ncbi:MAG TPA: hypothetical protein VMW16_13570 [Sedimentisphaerales bacterium]|nr:hypothetical protein [Sedimentisphaerales bacterium]
MNKQKKLRRKQAAVIDDLFAGEVDEQAILDKHKVSRAALNRWLGEDAFVEELERRMDWLKLQSELVIARYKALAAAKLVQLTESEKEETARKACLDIISLPKFTDKRSGQGGDEPQSKREPEAELSPETCSRLLAVLAEEPRGS